ncbi:MAG: hypothetical protein FWH28_00820, partial [Clostridiales bacterium]|nr:hypothetical protein [Clostridiales bacterium]
SYPEGGKEFIPMLTSDSEPVLPQLDNPIHIQLQYTAPLPIYVLYHLVVRLREDVDRLNTWKHGTYLTNQEDYHAIIRFGKTKDILDILVSGSKKQAYLAYIRQNLAYVQKDLTIEFQEYIEYSVNQQTVMLELERMLTMLSDGVHTDYVKEIRGVVSLIDVLRSIAPDKAIQALQARLREYEDDKIRYSKDQTDYIELRNLIYRFGSTTEMINERTRATSDKVDNIFATVGESSEKIDKILTNTDEILANMRSLRKAIQELQEFSDAQIVGIQSIFEALRGNDFEEGIADQIETILAEVRSGNTKNLRDKLILFLSVGGSVASLIGIRSDITASLKMLQDALQVALQALLKLFGLV